MSGQWPMRSLRLTFRVLKYTKLDFLAQLGRMFSKTVHPNQKISIASQRPFFYIFEGLLLTEINGFLRKMMRALFENSLVTIFKKINIVTETNTVVTNGDRWN